MNAKAKAALTALRKRENEDMRRARKVIAALRQHAGVEAGFCYMDEQADGSLISVDLELVEAEKLAAVLHSLRRKARGA